MNHPAQRQQGRSSFREEQLMPAATQAPALPLQDHSSKALDALFTATSITAYKEIPGILLTKDQLGALENWNYEIAAALKIARQREEASTHNPSHD